MNLLYLKTSWSQPDFGIAGGFCVAPVPGHALARPDQGVGPTVPLAELWIDGRADQAADHDETANYFL